MFPFVPKGLADVVDRLVPELQRRGLFSRDYEGTTLRDRLGLLRPGKRIFPWRFRPGRLYRTYGFMLPRNGFLGTAFSSLVKQQKLILTDREYILSSMSWAGGGP